ncbi:MAG: hypothetical protein ABIR32_22475 [Ilumatobacteraceae bacterium]
MTAPTLASPNVETVRVAGRWKRIGVGVVAVILLAVLERYAFSEGWRLQRQNSAIKLGAGPFVGSWELRLSAKILPAVAIAVTAVIWLPTVVRRLRSTRAALATAAVSALFAVALAASDGWHAIIAPVVHPTEYWQGTRAGGSVVDYLSSFLKRQGGSSVHVRGHPPGFSMMLLLLRSVGLGSAWFAAAISFAGVAMGVTAIGCTVRRLAGREAFVRSLPFLALAPYAIWQGTSADAFFSGLASVGIGLLVLAMTSTRRWVERTSAVVGGLVIGTCCLLTFATPTLIPLVAAVTWKTRRVRWIPLALVGTALVVGLFAVGGYWWLDGLTNTRKFYAAGTAKFRPTFYFFFANLAVLAIAVGPAAVAGLVRFRSTARTISVIVVGVLGCVLLADGSGLSKAETERIWLLYMPWISVAAAGVATTVGRQRWWLGSQATAAIVLQVALVSKW